MDLPNRVIRIAFFVFRTGSSSARHFTVHSKVAISFMTAIWTRVNVLYGNPKAYTALPAAIATYCFPSTAKAMGGA